MSITGSRSFSSMTGIGDGEASSRSTARAVSDVNTFGITKEDGRLMHECARKKARIEGRSKDHICHKEI